MAFEMTHSDQTNADHVFGPADGAIHVRVLGGLGLASRRARGLGSLGGRYHVRAALALLAASPEGLAKEALMDALWPDSAIRSAANRLHHTTHLLRRRLCQLAWPADWIHIGGDSIALDAAVTSDARRLNEAARNPAALDLIQLASLVIGIGQSADWVPGLDAGELGRQTAERCARDFQTVLFAACERAVEYGDTPVRRSLLGILHRCDPANEWAWRETMMLDLQASRRFHVQRAFAAVSRELTLRLGLRPSLQTLKIARTALDFSQVDAIPPPLPTGVSKPVDAQVMTESILAGGMFNVFGLDGVGKTTLMRAVEAQLATLDTPPQVSYWDAALVSPLHGWADLFSADDIVVVDHLKPSSRVWFEQLARAANRRDRPRTFILMSGTPVLDGSLVDRLPADLHSGFLAVLPPGPFNPVQCRVVLSRLLDPAISLTESQLDRLADLAGGMALAGQKIAASLVTMSADELLDQPDVLFEMVLTRDPRDRRSRPRLQAAFDEVCADFSSLARLAYPALGLVAGTWAPGCLHQWLNRQTGELSSGQFAQLMAEFGATGLLGRNDAGEVAVLPLARIHARRQAVAENRFEALLDDLLGFLGLPAQPELVPEGSAADARRIAGLLSLEPRLRPLIEDSRRFASNGFVRIAGAMGELALARGELAFGLRLCAQALDLVGDTADPARRSSILQTLLPLQTYARPDASIVALLRELKAPEHAPSADPSRREFNARLSRAYRACQLPVPLGLLLPEHEGSQESVSQWPAFLAARLALRRARRRFACDDSPAHVRDLVASYGALAAGEPNQFLPRLCWFIADHAFFLAEFEDARLWLTLAREHQVALSGAQSKAGDDHCLRAWLLNTFVRPETSEPTPQGSAFEPLPPVEEAISSTESMRIRVMCAARHLMICAEPGTAAQLLGNYQALDPAFIGASRVSRFIANYLVAPAAPEPHQTPETFRQSLDGILKAAAEPVTP